MTFSKLQGYSPIRSPFECILSFICTGLRIAADVQCISDSYKFVLRVLNLRDVIAPRKQLLSVYCIYACPMQVSDAGTFYTSAVTTSGEVRCEIPVFPLDSNATLQLYNWTVYLSTDNSTWSNGTQILVYDPVCVACNVTANNDTANETALTCLPSQVSHRQLLVHSHIESIFKCSPIVCTFVQELRKFQLHLVALVSLR